jgi:hypothetical protein
MIKGLAGSSALEWWMKKNFFPADPFAHEQEVALELHRNRKYHEKVFPKSNVQIGPDARHHRMRSSSGVVALTVFLEADSTFFARFRQIRDDFRCRSISIFELKINAIKHESCRHGGVEVIITATEA